MRALISLFIFTVVVSAQDNQILLDETFNDWNNVSVFIEDSDDNYGNGVDFKKLWVTNDDNYLFVRIDLFQEILIQEDTSTVILINTDNNNQTGSSELNSGAEIKYMFGKRSGYFYADNDSTEFFHSDIQLISSPTISSSSYEICISLNSIIATRQVFTQNDIELKFVNYHHNLDRIPDESEMLSYTILRDEGTSYPDFQLNKTHTNAIRILSYNVHRDDIFLEENYQRFNRIFNAINPDIIAFQEIYDHSSEDVANLIEQFLPSAENQNWYHAKTEAADDNVYNKIDVLVVSRFPVLESYSIQGYVYPQYGVNQSNSSFIIDIPGSEYNLMLVNAHPPCCQNNYFREIELQEIMAFIKDAKTSGGEIDLETNSPIVITGDMNLVGPSFQRDILTHGIFPDNSTYGENFHPDWDETSFADAKPFTTNLPAVFTWYNENESFSPGRLDYIIYSDYTLELINCYSLFTKSLPQDTLQAYGLNSDDTILASDHLPLVADFTIRELVNVKSGDELYPNTTVLYPNYPNPFNPETKITFRIPSKQQVSLIIYDILGRYVNSLVNEVKTEGYHSVSWDGKDYRGQAAPSGVYFYYLQTEKYIRARKAVLIK